MPKFRVYGVVTSTKWIGEFEAETKEQAEQMAWNSDEAIVSICYHCANEIDEPEITKMVVEEDINE